MPTKIVHAIEDGQLFDRWLCTKAVANDRFELFLSDLCRPDLLSTLKSVTFSAAELRDVAESGALQTAEQTEYCLLDRRPETMAIEFRGRGDMEPTFAAFPIALFAACFA